MPLDVLVPFWGDPMLLRETVDSVLRQSSGDWLLTVVDDAYPDESAAAYLASLGDPRVRYVRNERNLGITDNYRRCLELASQDMVVLLGCDDLMLPNFVEVVQAAHASAPGVAVIQPGVVVVDEHGQLQRTLVDSVKQKVTMPGGRGTRVLGGERLAVSLLRANWMYWPSLVFRRDVLTTMTFLENLPLIQDLGIVIDIVAGDGRMLLEPTVCFAYRRHGASASSARLLDGARFEGERRYFRIAARQMEERGWHRAARAARWHVGSRAHALSLVPRALRERDRAATRRLLRHALAPLRLNDASSSSSRVVGG